MPSSLPRLAFVGALVASVVGCSDRKSATDTTADVGGTFIVATSSDADYLLPPLIVNLQSKAIADQIFDRLADIGPEMNVLGDRGFAPRLAERWDWAADSLSIRFHLNPRARWHDGVPVRASDVRFTFDLTIDPKVASQNASLLRPQIDSVTVADSLTAVFWFAKRYPQQFFDATYHLLIIPEHSLSAEPRDKLAASTFARAPVGSGRFRFARWEPGATIEVLADTANYRGRPKLDRVVWSVSEPGTSFTRAFAGEVDFAEPLVNPALLPEVAKNPNVAVRSTAGADYGYIAFNLMARGSSTKPHPLFGERRLRRALAMAINRETVVRSVFDSLSRIAIGPMTHWQFNVDTTVTQIPYDTLAARALLDSLGWRDTNGDGIRERNGRPLAFALGYPSSSASRQRMAVILQSELQRVGAKVNIDSKDINTFISLGKAGDFDALLNATRADPSPFSVRQSWSKAGARTKGGSNFSMYENPVFDANLDSAVVEWNPDRVRRLSTKAYETIIGDAPAIWLYEPKYSAVVHRRLHVTGMRPDAWWARLDEWYIPAAERIDRDKIGLATPAR